jgi:signal transduction histidine kinase
VQVPAGAFALQETFFVNRVLDAVSLLLLAGLLHVWMRSAATGEAQARRIEEQDEKLRTAQVSRRMVEVQETERRAVASQLHDLVGQKLTALSINLTVARSQLLPGEATQIGARLDDSLKMIEETTESIRDVMAELRPAVLDDFGLAPVLRWYAEQFTRRSGVMTSVVEEGQGPRLAPAAEHALFRMAQNALANVASHAHADQAVMTLRTTPHSTCLIVADDGNGFDPAAVDPPARDHGWGLIIMRERAAAIGAHVKVDSAPGRGTRIVVTMDGGAHDQGSAGG